MDTFQKRGFVSEPNIVGNIHYTLYNGGGRDFTHRNNVHLFEI